MTTEMADSDFHDYINFEYYLQNIGKYRNSYVIHSALSCSDSGIILLLCLTANILLCYNYVISGVQSFR